MSRYSVVALLAMILMGSSGTFGQEPPKLLLPMKPVEEGNPQLPIPKDWPKLEDIKPIPPVAIPDDPPPHEGAMIDIPVTIEPPDIIDIEVLEALPGRPITGEHLVKPDGKITLGFYGDVHVRGLTPEQVKIKIILHLQKYMDQEPLGLIEFRSVAEQANPNVEPGANGKPGAPGVGPFELKPNFKGPELPDVVPPELFKKPEPGPKPAEIPKNSTTASRSGRWRTIRPSLKASDRGTFRQTHRPIDLTAATIKTGVELRQDAPLAPQQGAVLFNAIEVKRVHPADSNRVFVEVVAFNSKVYYVQGDVGVPGRLPWTGKETVLDALNYAGGFVPTAEPEDIHLYRPARGGKPAKDYKIDHAAILRGVATANLQLFPDDRLVVSRNAIVKKTIEIDRAISPIASVFNSLFQQSLTTRYVNTTGAPVNSGSGGAQVKVNGQNVPIGTPEMPAMTVAQRDAFIKEYFEFLWSITSKEGGALLDEARFREALMKRLSTPTPVAPEPKQ